MADTARVKPTPSDSTFERTWGNATGPFAWLKAVNNGPIGMRYLVTGFAFFLVGGFQALLMRTQLATAENDFLSPELYNQLFTMHGSTMMFLFVVPILEGLGTLIGPTMLGTRDLPFPRLTAFGYWCYLFGGILMYSSFLFGLAPDGGWFAYVPLTGPEFSPGLNIDFWLLGLELAEAAGIIAAFELIIAILTMRAPGMTLSRMPLFLWAMLVTSVMILFAFVTVLIGSLFLELDRKFGTQFYNVAGGGDPLLWQHLFWIFGHPEVYIQFLPAAGIVSTIVPVFARRPVVSYPLIVLALVATGFASFGLWAHHMFTVGLPNITASFFTAASMTIAIPTGIQFFVWIATIWHGKVVWKAPFLFVVGFIVNFLIGGLTGVMVAVVPFNWQVHDSYFVVAHFHYVLIGGVVFPLLAAFYYWMPKVTGRLLSERLGRWNFWLMFIGFNVAFFPMHLSGFLGMPRRVYTYGAGLGWDLYNLISTVGAFIFALGVLLFVFNYIRSLVHGEEAGRNPWGADTLEWAAPSPVPTYGFRTLPIVHSRHPLWEQERFDEGDARTESVVKTLAEWPTTWQAGIVSSVMDGELLEIFRMPNFSYWPFVMASGLAIATIALLIDFYSLGLLGGLLIVVGYVGWNWPSKELEHNERAEEIFRNYGVKVYLHGSPTIARWTAFLALVVAGVSLGSLLFSYFYLQVNAGRWPPEGSAPSELLLPAIASGFLLLSVLPMRWATASIHGLERGRTMTGLALGFLLGAAAFAVQLYTYLQLPFTWQSSAYGSIFVVLASYQLFLLFVSLIMSTIAQLRLGLVRDDVRVHTSVDNASLVWHFATVAWFAIGFTLYLSPRLF